MRPILLAVLAVSPFLHAFPPAAGADPGIVSTMELMMASESVDGISIVPATDAAPQVYTGDLAPPQVFEIIRPDMHPLMVGRLTTSCTCISVSMPKRDFGKGERALLEVRNVKATPAGGATYAIFVQLSVPARTALQYDIFMKSERQTTAPPPPSGSSRPAELHDATAVERMPPATPRPPAFRYEDITPYPARTR